MQAISKAEWWKRQQISRDKIKFLPGGIKVELHSVRVPRRPGGESEWDKDSLHYSCAIIIEGEPFHCWYSMGSAHRWQHAGKIHDCEPLAADVLYSLISEGASFRSYRDLDDFAAEMCEGLPPSKATEVYKSCRATDRYLSTALGDYREAVEEYFQDY